MGLKCGWIVEDSIRRTLGQCSAVVEHVDAVGQAGDHLHVVFDPDDGDIELVFDTQDNAPGPWLKRPAEDCFKMFLADTALSGAVEATRCGLDYFGADKVLFASDFPFDAEGGKYLVRETIKALDALDLAPPIRRKIDFENITDIISGSGV
jgi:hypothetical protein